MLKLILRPHEDVFLADNIRIIVLDIDPNGKNVKLGFMAPREIRILRGRFFQQLTNEKQQKPENTAQNNTSQTADQQ